MCRTFKILPLLVNLLAVAATIWIVVPALDYRIWLFSVAVSEWSLWFAALALIGIFGSLSIGIFYKIWQLQTASLIAGSIALAISLYPFLSVLSISRERNISLSLKSYSSGVWQSSETSKETAKNFTTYTFAQVDGKNLQMDVYAPAANAETNGASVIVVHGGSWNAGERSDFPQWNRWLAANGYTVFDIDYRLTPQPNYLTATGDVKCAVRWIKNHAAAFKVSPERIAILGRSAGAHLALLAAYSANDARLPATCGDNNADETIRAVVSFYAPIDLLWGFDNPANQLVIDSRTTLINFLGGNPHESAEIRNRFVLVSPTSHVSAGTPPTFLIHGGQDQLVRSENMQRLATKLSETKTPHETVYIPYAQHGFDYNFNGLGAQIVQPAILEFLRANTSVK